MLGLASLAPAANYDEATDGDLSGNPLLPTTVSLDLGSNVISAASMAGDVEYFHVVVPAGRQLERIDHASFTSANTRAFLGMQLGSTFTVPADTAEASDLAGYVHFGFETLGTDLLPTMSTSFGAQQFSLPLGPGDYTFWSQQIEPIPASYAFSMVLVPEPTAALAALPPTLLLRRRATRRRH